MPIEDDLAKPAIDSSTLNTPSSPDLYAHARSNVARLTIAQALSGANAVVVYATAAIVGNALAPDHALATLPISIFVVGMAACSLPAGAIAQHYGRRTAFLAGTGCGVLVGLFAALAVVLGSFWLFCAATFFGGAYAAVVSDSRRSGTHWFQAGLAVFLAQMCTEVAIGLLIVALLEQINGQIGAFGRFFALFQRNLPF